MDKKELKIIFNSKDMLEIQNLIDDKKNHFSEFVVVNKT